MSKSIKKKFMFEFTLEAKDARLWTLIKITNAVYENLLNHSCYPRNSFQPTQQSAHNIYKT